MNNINYYKNKENSVVIKLLKNYDLYNEGNFNSDNIKDLICNLIINKKVVDLDEILKELFENYKFDRDYEFDKYFKYDNEFIIVLLIYYKNKTKISKKNFKLLLIKEKENKSNSIVNFNILDKYKRHQYILNGETTTPLHIACSCQKIETIKILQKYGANINIKNSRNFAPLNDMRFGITEDIFKFLINNGADINEIDDNDNSILHRTCIFKKGYFMNLILNCKKYRVNINKVNCYGNTALHELSKREDYRIEGYKVLIEKGANLNIKNNDGETPLLLLCYKQYKYNILKFFIDNGADVNIKNNKGETALILTSIYGEVKDAQILIKNGANINETDNEGNTALYNSCRNFRSGVYINLYLMNIGADVNIQNNEGNVPLHEVCCWGSRYIMKIFIKHNANLNICNNNNETPISIAYLHNNREIIEYLKEIKVI
ncbi:ankyrin repeat-containing domain protein [Neocallimastix sp. 'constans']